MVLHHPTRLPKSGASSLILPDMSKYLVLIAVAVIAAQRWYLAGQRETLDKLRAENISELNPSPDTTRPSRSEPAAADIGQSNELKRESDSPALLSVSTGRALKDFAARESDDVQHLRAAYLASPELAAAGLAEQRRRIMLKYGLFFKMAGLTAEQMQKVGAILLDRDNMGNDIDAAMTGARRPGQKRDFGKDANLTGTLLQVGAEDIKGLLKEELGDEKFAKYADYEVNLSRYATVAALQQELSATPASVLSATQEEKLAELFKQDSGAVGRVLLPVTDNNHAQFEVDGLRFAVVATKDVVLVDGRQLESGYLPSEEILRQASFLTQAQIQALLKLTKKRSAGHALAGDFWVKPVQAGGRSK